MLDAHLSRAPDVPGRMQRHSDAVEVDCLAVRQRFEWGIVAKPRPKNVLAFAGAEITPTAPTHVIGVRVRNNSARDWPPGVHVEITGRTIQTILG
jgi:hypothetical protein